MVSAHPIGPALVTLTTDFGLGDAYVGVMKGVILARAPRAQIVDLCHEIGPQGVLEGAFVFDLAWRFFAAGTVHVVVVDPGVGTNRRRLAIAAEGHIFVGPDNACLAGALPAGVRGRRATGAAYEPQEARLPSEIVAVSIENESLMLQPVSATFEGRDVFAPAAAHLARGVPLTDLGPRVNRLNVYPEFRAPRTETGLDGRVMRVDRFGNLITDLHAEDLPPQPMFLVAGRRVPLVKTYGAATALAAMVGSSGLVEIALPKGDAARLLGAGPGDRVVVA